MILQPKKNKYQKIQKKRVRKIIGLYNSSKHDYFYKIGTYSLVCVESGRFTSKQIEAIRRILRIKLQRKGRIWMTNFPNISVSSKGTSIRIGRGKGTVSFYCFKAYPGTVLCEIIGVSKEIANKALVSAKKKVPFKAKIQIKKGFN